VYTELQAGCPGVDGRVHRGAVPQEAVDEEPGCWGCQEGIGAEEAPAVQVLQVVP
jgi:hypothetical protein